MKKKTQSPELLIFDFDGTISHFDIFKLIILIRCINPSSWPSIIKSFFLWARDKDLTIRQALYRNLWKNQHIRLTFFEELFRRKSSNLLFRKSMLELISAEARHVKVLVLSANEKEVIDSFLKIYFPSEMHLIDVIATNSLMAEEPIKGCLKVSQYENYLKENKILKFPIVHSFFDTRSDFAMANCSTVAINLNLRHRLTGVNRKYGYITLGQYLSDWS